MRSVLLAALGLLILVGCGAGGGGVIEPEKKGAANSPMTNQSQGQKPGAANTSP